MPQLYTITSVTIQDRVQLNQFFRSMLPASVKYSNILYMANSSKMIVYTHEEVYSTTTYDKLLEVFIKYPNPPPLDVSGIIDEEVVSSGDLLTFDKNLKKTVRVPVGLPGQLLTVDPASNTGIGWRDFSSEASNGSRVSVTDLFYHYIDVFDSGGTSRVTQTPSYVEYNITRRKDIQTYSHGQSDWSGITLNEGGIFTFFIKTGVQWADQRLMPDFDALVKCVVEVTAPDGVTKYEIPNSVKYIILPTTTAHHARSTRYTEFAFRSLNGGETLRMKVQEITNTGNIQFSPTVSSFSCMRVVIDSPSVDITNHATYYDSVGNITIGNTWQLIPMLTDAIAIEGQPSASPLITVDSTGFFRINSSAIFHLYWKIGLEITNAMPGDVIVYNFDLVYDVGAGWTQYKYSQKSGSITVISGTNMPRTGALFAMASFPPNTKFAFRARVISNTGSGVLKTIQNVSSVNILVPNSTLTGQDNIKGISAYSTQILSITPKSWVDVPLDDVFFMDDVFNQNSSNTITQCSEKGTYVVLYRVAVKDPLSTKLGNVSARIVMNAGQGFLEASGSRSSIYYTNGLSSAIIGSALLYMGYNYQLKLQLILEDPDAIGSSYAETMLGSCDLTVVKLEKTIEPFPIPGTNVFGTYYSQTGSYEEQVTVSTDYVPVVQLNSSNIPQGVYKLTWRFNWTTSSSTENFIAQIVMDNVTVIRTYTQKTTQAFGENVVYDFDILSLTSGLHSYTLQFNTSSTSAEVRMKNIKMDFMRVE